LHYCILEFYIEIKRYTKEEKVSDGANSSFINLQARRNEMDKRMNKWWLSIKHNDNHFYGQLAVDVKIAFEKIIESLIEIEESNERRALVALPQVFIGHYPEWSGTIHRLMVQDKIFIESIPSIMGAQTPEIEGFTLQNTCRTTVLRGEFEYLSPPIWVYAGRCDCYGSNVVGSYQYKGEII
jgi:hypothetical protein